VEHTTNYPTLGRRSPSHGGTRPTPRANRWTTMSCERRWWQFTGEEWHRLTRAALARGLCYRKQTELGEAYRELQDGKRVLGLPSQANSDDQLPF
jgi:hypothetical protein